MTTTTEDINGALADMGYSMSVETIDPGGYDKPSKHKVTISRGGKSFTTDYSKGPVRFWSIRNSQNLAGLPGWIYGTFGPKIKNGDQLPFSLKKYKFSDQQLRDLQKYTTHRPIELADVLLSLTMVADGVRHGQTFEDWAGDFGYNSRTAERLFNLCRDSWSGLCGIGADLDELSELFVDY